MFEAALHPDFLKLAIAGLALAGLLVIRVTLPAIGASPPSDPDQH